VALLANNHAPISRDLLDNIIAKAKTIPAWQRAVIERTSVPRGLHRNLTQFLTRLVGHNLVQSGAIDPHTAQDVVDAVKRRVDSTDAMPTESEEIARARYLFAYKKLTDTEIMDALALGQGAFVRCALALRSELDDNLVMRILGCERPKPIVALCWKAGLAMRTAVAIQQKVAKIRPTEVVLARGGEHYPLTPDEMQAQLEFFGITS
jgi:uncharacterized protein (DUF2336 family)